MFRNVLERERRGLRVDLARNARFLRELEQACIDLDGQRTLLMLRSTMGRVAAFPLGLEGPARLELGAAVGPPNHDELKRHFVIQSAIRGQQGRTRDVARFLAELCAAGDAGDASDGQPHADWIGSLLWHVSLALHAPPSIIRTLTQEHDGFGFDVGLLMSCALDSEVGEGVCSQFAPRPGAFARALSAFFSGSEAERVMKRLFEGARPEHELVTAVERLTRCTSSHDRLLNDAAVRDAAVRALVEHLKDAQGDAVLVALRDALPRDTTGKQFARGLVMRARRVGNDALAQRMRDSFGDDFMVVDVAEIAEIDRLKRARRS